MESPWQRLATLDAALSRRALRLVRQQPWRGIAIFIAHTGDSLLWLAVGLLLWWLGGKLVAAGTRIIITVLLTGAVSGALKLLFRRRRPHTEPRGFFLRYDRHGFPSGHATRVGGLMLVLGAMLPPWGTALLAVWGIAVCASRVALGLHFVGDIGGGLLVGWLIALGIGYWL
ncbi:MAG: phosphatase PAP2 family protein [Anaerolineae bacterium]|jgi:undecaprenyl-diphosphatase|nr:phosphatase PAP2 family protein [Anaerolineae bacterium]